jgi:hypothetical protein
MVLTSPDDSTGSTGNGLRTESESPEQAAPNDGATDSVGSTVAEEVVRIESVRWLEGATGHGIISLGFLSVAVFLLELGRRPSGLMAVLVAYGVALNGISIYVWNRLRRSLHAVFERRSTDPDRALRPDISAETKAEVLTGFLMVGGLAVALTLLVQTLSLVDPWNAVSIAIVALAVVDVGALVWTVRQHDR